MNFLIVLLGYLIITSFFTYGAGWLVLFFTKNQNFSKEDQFGRFYLGLIIGFLLISSVTAIVSTNGVTISWLVLLPVLYFLYRTSSPFVQKFNPPQKLPIVATGLILGVSLMGIWIFHGAPMDLSEISVHDDFYFYAKNAGSLMETSIESSRSLHHHNISVESNEIYHFGNLWFVAFYLEMFNCSEVAFLLFVSYPLLITICLLGCIRFFSPRNVKQVIFYLTVIFVGFLGMTIHFDSSIPVLESANLWYGEIFGQSPTTLKLAPVLALAPLLFHFILNRKFVNIACFVLIISAIYSSIIPGAFGIFAGLLIWCYFFDKKYTPKDLLKCSLEAIIILIVGVLYLVTYQELATNPKPPKPFFEITKSEAIVWALKYLLYPFLIFIGLAPSLIWSIIKKTKQLTAIIFCLIAGLIASICFVILNIFQMDINQVIINFMMVFMPILLVYFLSKFRRNKMAFGILIVVLSISASIKFTQSNLTDRFPIEASYKFRKEVYTELRHHNWVMVRKEVPWKWYFIFDNPAKFILNHPNTIYPVDITSGILKKGRSPFRNKGFDIPGYLKEKKVEFIFAENGAQLPKDVKLDLVLRDPKSGHQFYKIKY